MVENGDGAMFRKDGKMFRKDGEMFRKRKTQKENHYSIEPDHICLNLWWCFVGILIQEICHKKPK